MTNDLDPRLSGLRGRVQTAWSPARAEHVLAAIEQRKVRRQQLRRGAAVAVAGCALFIIMPLLFGRLTHEPATQPGVAVALRLPDGSTATALLPDTELKQAEPQPGSTVLRLLRGSARFEVQRNPQRVFRVEAGRAAVEVLGTQFTVSRRDERAEVAVLQGRVRVLWDSHYRELGAGERGLFPPPESASLPAPEVSPVEASGPAAPAAVELAVPLPEPAPLPSQARPRSPAPGLRPEQERTGSRAALESWRALAQDGQFDQAYRALEAKDLAAASDEPGDLLLLADIARLSHHPAEAVAPLERMLREHRSDPRSALCAFTLGRVLLDDLGKPREAAAAFREAQSLDPGFAMIEDALAREVKALWRAGDSAAAHERALEYLRRFPEGRSARAVRRFGATD